MTPQERRVQAQKLLAQVEQETPKDQLLNEPWKRIEDINGERRMLYNMSAVKKLCNAIINASDETLKGTEHLNIYEAFDRFVFLL